jgi:hypothetical protein
MANTFLAARGVKVGKSLCEHDLAATAEAILEAADKANCTVHLPYDVVVAKEFAANPPSLRTCNVHEVADDEMILDVGPAAVEALQGIQGEVGFTSIQYDDQIGKLSLVGAGMRSNPGVSATFFKALANAGVNIEMISTSEIRISVITRDDLLDEAVRAVHTAFGLDSSEGEAVVYGGTGR